MSEGRIVVLNYHRVVPDLMTEKFYDVTWSTFEAQMRCLADRSKVSEDGSILLDNGSRVEITFDDSTQDHFEVARTLRDLGLNGVFFVITGTLGTPDRLTTAQVERMAADGHRIGSHTVTHARLPESTDAELENELVNSKHFLERLLGVEVDWLAPPGGLFDDRVMSAATDAGYRTIRTMEWGYARAPLLGRVPTLPVLPTYDLNGFGRLLDGNAPLWRYRLKTRFKQVVGEGNYVKVRNRVHGFLRR